MKGCFLFFGSSTLRFLGMSSPYRNPPNQKQLYIYIKIRYDDKCDYTPAHGQNTQTDFFPWNTLFWCIVPLIVLQTANYKLIVCHSTIVPKPHGRTAGIITQRLTQQRNNQDNNLAAKLESWKTKFQIETQTTFIKIHITFEHQHGPQSDLRGLNLTSTLSKQRCVSPWIWGDRNSQSNA